MAATALCPRPRRHDHGPGKDLSASAAGLDAASACSSRRWRSSSLSSSCSSPALRGAEPRRWSSSTRSTPAPATAAPPGWSTARACPSPRAADGGDRRSRRSQSRDRRRHRRLLGERYRGRGCRASRTKCSIWAPISPRPGEIEGALRIIARQVERLEQEIDAMNADARAADQLHPARRVAGRRRAPLRPRRRSPRRAGRRRLARSRARQSARRWPI